MQPSVSDAYFASLPPAHKPLVTPQQGQEYSVDANVESYLARLEFHQSTACTFLHQLASATPDPRFIHSTASIVTGLGLERTPYDSVKGQAISIMSDPSLRNVAIGHFTRSLRYMEVLTHPVVLEARLAMLHAPTPERPRRQIAPIEAAILKGQGLTWADLGWGINDRADNGIEEESTTNIRCQGLWSRLTFSKDRPIVASPILAPSHPDLVSMLSIATCTILGSYSFVPGDGPYLGRSEREGLRAQMTSVKAAFQMIEMHPLMITHGQGHEQLSNGEYVRQHLVREARQRVGVTLKAHPPEAAAARAKELYAMGVRCFRVFDPRDTKALPKAIEAVRRECPEAFIIASQITSPSSGKSCATAGADMLIMNIGDGGHCSTASGTGMIPNNPVSYYRVQQCPELARLGIVLDGGMGPLWVMAMGLGASGTMKHGSLLGGTIEQCPCLIVLLDPATGNFVKLQSGEAAQRTKHRGYNVDVAGQPANVEGIDSHVRLFSNPLGATVPEIMYRDLLRGAAKQLGFWQAEALEQLQMWDAPVILMPTEAALRMAAPHFSHGA